MVWLVYRRRIDLWRAVLIVTLSGTFLVTGACQRETPRQSSGKAETTEMQTISLPVEGMSCGACAARLKKRLKAIDGVRDVHVSLEERNARIDYEQGKFVPGRLTTAINELGYKAGTPAPSKLQ